MNQSRHVTLTDFLQAREANMCLTRDGLHMTPGLSLSMKMSSSMSPGPNVQFLLVGRDTSFTRSITWAAGAQTHSHVPVRPTSHASAALACTGYVSF